MLNRNQLHNYQKELIEKAKYRGISKIKNKWHLNKQIKNQRFHFGSFSSKEEAMKRADQFYFDNYDNLT